MFQLYHAIETGYARTSQSALVGAHSSTVTLEALFNLPGNQKRVGASIFGCLAGFFTLAL